MVIFQIMITYCILTSMYVLGTMHMYIHFVGKFMCVIIYNLHIPQNIHATCVYTIFASQIKEMHECIFLIYTMVTSYIEGITQVCIYVYT